MRNYVRVKRAQESQYITLTLLPSSTTFAGPPRSAVFAVYAAIKSPQQILLTFNQRKKEWSLEEVINWRRYQRAFQHITKSRRFFANFFPPDLRFFWQIQLTGCKLCSSSAGNTGAMAANVNIKDAKEWTEYSCQDIDFRRWGLRSANRQRQFLNIPTVLRYGVFTS